MEDRPNDARRVLVIDGDPGVRRMLRFPLTAASFHVIDTTSGVEALEILNHLPPEALVLDPDLPDGLGGEILDRLRDLHRENAHSPAWIVISTLDSEDLSIRHGPVENHFLAKPFDPWELVRLLKDDLCRAKTKC